jgi:hypothetical protein
MTTTLAAETHTAWSRIRGEYLEMPGLRLTTAQAARLCHLAPTDCEEILGELVMTGFLRRTRSGQYMRNDTGLPS